MEMNRRQFLAGAAVAGAAALGTMAGCAPQDSAPKEGASDNAKTSQEPASQPAAASWKDKPEPITDIVETVEADVVVVGAGIGGVCSALKAVQSGAKTICLQKGDIVLTHGGNFGAINSRFQKEAGNPEIDMMDILAHHLKYNNYRPQYDYAKVIFNESAETLEWIADSTGLTWNPSKPRTINTMDWDNTTFPTGHTSDAGKAIDIAQIIADKAMELGAEFRFNTPYSRRRNHNNSTGGLPATGGGACGQIAYGG